MSGSRRSSSTRSGSGASSASCAGGDAVDVEALARAGPPRAGPRSRPRPRRPGSPRPDRRTPRLRPRRWKTESLPRVGVDLPGPRPALTSLALPSWASTRQGGSDGTKASVHHRGAARRRRGRRAPRPDSHRPHSAALRVLRPSQDSSISFRLKKLDRLEASLQKRLDRTRRFGHGPRHRLPTRRRACSGELEPRDVRRARARRRRRRRARRSR